MEKKTQPRTLVPGSTFAGTFEPTGDGMTYQLIGGATKADALLMVAAPELLEVCEMLSRLAPSNEGIGGHAPIGAFFAAAHKARAAILKVNGR